ADLAGPQRRHATERQNASRARCGGWLGGTVTRIFPEGEYQAITISDHEVALGVDAAFGAIEDGGTAGAQFLGKCVNPYHAEVRVIGALRSACATIRAVGAVEEHLDLVARHHCKDRRSVCNLTGPLSVPITGYLETENVPVILGCPHDIW